ncbi:FHIPEP family type III secretion protein [Priestia filamentosa]|uniref:FHIPEP family type III secretion protein n=1 Tax=Priestia filamentosa TaxID=1402861 RepID=UPI00397809C4
MVNNLKNYFPIMLAISFVIALLMPLPGWMLDMLVVLILGVSVWVYMNATRINEWNEMKTFPSILLFVGIFRVSVNISTTRNILTEGQPGHVIEQFGNFVIDGNLLVGAVMFIVLIIFQFIVANGSSRTAEVAARFTLDAMPGKQMAIDAATQAREITREEAEEQRKLILMESDFYGAMDGASKFIKGDVIFGIAILFINVIFGLIVGIMQKGMTFADALHKYTLLTVGDGIVSQIGSLLIAIASGLVVTRVFDNSGKTLPGSIYAELMSNGTVVYSLGGLFIAMGVFTQLPILPFVLMGSVVIYLGIQHQRKLAKEKSEKIAKELEEIKAKEQQEGVEEVSNNVELGKKKELILLEIGLDLIPLISKSEKAKNKIELMRKIIATQLGIRVPAISIKDNTSLKPKGKYVIKVKGAKVAEGILKSGHLLALKTPHTLSELNSEPTKDPIFNEEGYWIEEDMVSEARIENYQVLEPLGIMVTHLDMSIRKNLHEIMNRQQVKELVSTLEEEFPVLIEEIKEEKLSLSTIQTVLQNLLKEGISIQDLPSIIEGILDGKRIYSNVDDIMAVVREKISKQLTEKAISQDGKVHAILFDEEIELKAEIYADGHKGYFLNWDIEFETRIVEQLAHAIRKVRLMDREPVLVVRRRDFRFGILKTLRRYNTDIQILCVDELEPDILIEYETIIN